MDRPRLLVDDTNAVHRLVYSLEVHVPYAPKFHDHFEERSGGLAQSSHVAVHPLTNPF